MINISEKARIIDFIQNPIKIGIWETIFEWNNTNTIEKELRRREVELRQNSTLPFVVPTTTNLVTNPLMILELFNFLAQEKNSNSVYNPVPSSLQNLDINFLKRLNNNFDNFDNIYTIMEDFSINLTNGIEVKGEYAYILQQPNLGFPQSNNLFIILSTNKNISNNIKKILESCEAITPNTKQRFLRSPQNKLITPLFDFTNFISNNLFTDWENIHYFNEAYNLYYQQKYDNSISYIGKMTESLLTTIYESLFQEHVPDGFTIGQLQNSLQSKVKDIYRNDNNRIEPASFEKIREYCSTNMEIIPIIHQITTLLKDEQKYRDSLLTENQSRNIEHNIFPKNIFINLKKILNYRNSVSHNSGTFFNVYDCQKMLFYFLSVYNWWQEIYDEIDWTENQEKIIKKIVEEN